MNVNFLYGSEENLPSILSPGNIYITLNGCMYVDLLEGQIVRRVSLTHIDYENNIKFNTDEIVIGNSGSTSARLGVGKLGHMILGQG